MSVFLYKFFHNKTNDRIEEGKIPVPDDMNKWPDSWKVIRYKNYKLFPIIKLPVVQGVLWSLTQQRQSRKRPLPENRRYVTLENLSYIIRSSYGLQTNSVVDERQEKRVVPSAGHRYPLEIYVLLFRDTVDLQAGIYHYGVKDHVLEPVRIAPFTTKEIDIFSAEVAAKDANGVVCISAIFKRTIEKYGSRGYRYILFEAGHVAQNMLLAATEKDVALTPIGGSSERSFEHVIGLNSSYEGVVYTLFF